MSQQTCPFLVTVDQNYNQGPPVDYPSFENHCSASGESDSLLFPHQATFCLSNGHRLCPLFKAARKPTTTRTSARQEPLGWQPVRTPRQQTETTLEDSSEPTLEPVAFINGETPLGVERMMGEQAWLDNRRRWSWIGAAAVFVAVLLFGGLAAAWAGWNFANAQLEVQPGQVTIAAAIVTPTPAAAEPYVVWTATSPAGAVVAVQPTTEPAGESFNFPVAVTATPAPVVPNANNLANTTQNGDGVPVVVVQPPTQGAILVPPGGQGLPDILVEIPTRRDTPDVQLAINLTEAAQVELTPTPTETPTPLGTPVVIFGADAKNLKTGECTTVRWSVQNVKEVYYENIGVDGSGDREECLGQKDGVYLLRVVLPNGAMQIYSTTVTLELPTPTPTVTWTFTPEPVFTPTWTPIPPTATQIPNIRRGVSLAVQGGNQHSCASNSNCSVGLLVTNTGEEIDNISVNRVSGDAWSPQLCRADAVCGSQVPLVSVGPGNTVYLEFRLSLPSDATSGQQQSYQLIAISDGSGNTVGSQPVTIEVLVQ